MMTKQRYKKYVSEFGEYSLNDKGRNLRDHVFMMLNRLSAMFEYTNLPDGLKNHEREIKLGLFISGYIIINTTPIGGKYYPFYGGLGGEPDAYYMPTIATVNNPGLNISEQWKIHKDCVVIANDSNYCGLMPILLKYGTLLNENEISMYMGMINTRMQTILSAKDDTTKASAEKYIGDLISGKISVIGDVSKFLDDDLHIEKNQNGSSTGALKDLLEVEQYLKGSEYSELGLSAPFNMKREAINSAESNLNNDILYPLVDDMLKTQQTGWSEFNNITGENVSVKLASSWKDNKEEESETIKALNQKGENDEQ